jgi:hypothetical protein
MSLWEVNMTIQINLSESKSYLFSVAEAIDAFVDEAKFQPNDQARIICAGLPLPSQDIVTLTGIHFERQDNHAFTAWLRSSKTSQARHEDQAIEFETVVLDNAAVDIAGNVTRTDGKIVRAVQVIPAKLPYVITDLDWRIVHQTISSANAEDRCYARPAGSEGTDFIATGRELNLLNYSALMSLENVPYLKVIQRDLLKHNPNSKVVSEQKISDTLSKFGIRHKRKRPRRATI